MELDVGTDQVGDDVRENGPGGKLPVRGMAIVRAGEPPEPRRLGTVPVLEVPYRVRSRYLPTVVDHLVGDRAEPLEPFVGDDLFEQQIAVLEIGFPLLFRENLGPDRQDLVRGHGNFLLPDDYRGTVFPAPRLGP